MEIVVIVLLVILIPVIVFIRHSKRIKNNETAIFKLKSEVAGLKSRLNRLEYSDPEKEVQASPPPQPSVIKPEIDEQLVSSIEAMQQLANENKKAKDKNPDIPSRSAALQTAPYKAAIPPTAPPQKQSREKEQTKPVKKKKSERLIKLEKLFIENWIGIIGSLVMVIGVTFLGIYAAVKMNEFVRFLLITGIAVVLFVLYLVLKRKQFWKDLALWLRSASAAVLLFSCLGAGFLPGLRFINATVPALAILCLGIAVNILLAFLSASELFAGLHTLFSMAVLAVVPQQPAIIIFAAIIAGCGIIITFWQKWQYHLLLTISLFFGYTMFWIFSNQPLSSSVSLIAVIMALLVHVPAILIHYHKMYSGTKFKTRLFIIHLLNWIYLAISLLLLSSGSKWKAFLILAASIAVFVLARQAKRMNIRWLYVTDNLIGQAIAYAAMISFAALNLDTSVITVFMIIETFIFSALMILEKEETLLIFGQTCLQLLGLVFGGIIMYNYIETRNVNVLAQAFLLLLPVNSSFLFSLLLRKKEQALFEGSPVPAKPVPKALLLAGATLFSVGLLVLKRIPPADFPPNSPAYIWILSLTMFAFVRPNMKTETMSTLFSYLYLAFALIGSFILNNHIAELELVHIGAIAVLQILLFTFIHIKGKQHALFKSGNVLLTIAVLLFGVFNFITMLWSWDWDWQYLVIDSIMLLLLLFFHYYFHSKQIKTKEGGSPNFFVQGLFIAGIIPGIIHTIIINMSGHAASFAAGFTVCAILAALYIIRSRFRSDGIGFGVLLYSLLLFFLSWYSAIDENLSGGAILISALPFFLLSLVFCLFSGNYRFGGKKIAIPAPGFYLAVLQIAVTIYYVMRPVSALVAGPVWLVLSVLVLETAFVIRKLKETSLLRQGKADLHLIISGYLLIAAFIVRHIGVHLQSSAVLFGLVRYRFLIEALSILIFVYWYTRAAEKDNPMYRFFEDLKSLFFELIVITVGAIILLEVPKQFQPLAWILAAIIWFILGQSKSEKLNRLRFSAVLFFWAAAIHIPLVTARYKTTMIDGFDPDWVLALAAIILQFVFLIIFHRRGQIKDLIVPKAVNRLTLITEAMSKRINVWVYYPLFVSVTLFIIWSFSRNFLTVALMVETLMVFVLSVILRENHFRYLASAGILACLAKLFFVDLHELDNIVKAIVFIAVAGILILINAIYSKYKDRFKVKNEK